MLGRGRIVGICNQNGGSGDRRPGGPGQRTVRFSTLCSCFCSWVIVSPVILAAHLAELTQERSDVDAGVMLRDVDLDGRRRAHACSVEQFTGRPDPDDVGSDRVDHDARERVERIVGEFAEPDAHGLDREASCLLDLGRSDRVRQP